ncbi:periplasmic binding protein-like II [Anaeromyces robustus]|uniref:Periplasmic binding protein-like II n=1 Tax=Anaeromyces robustus TaxID=1754192 RepID=A0A1Y1X0V9_9FUNG|nr:periplasmic binding protein-like II [Anaeromyces robustus]|eukprot:ORX79447.1 periplasmic binding protein-like II [Anaeromyces robustus]
MILNISKYIIIILSLYIYIVKGITINGLAFGIDDTNNEIYKSIESEFNKYSSNNNLDITLKITILSNANSTFSIKSFGTTIDSFLKKKSIKFEIYFYDSLYISDYEPYLLDLNKYIPKENIEKFDKNIFDQICTYNNRLVGIPARIGYTVLYSNKALLDKYSKDIPKTWDELLSTSKYIYNEEKKFNNTNLIAFNGLFDDSESGFCSMYELIHSYRNSVDSPYPKFTSQEAIDALNMIKNLKKEISSEKFKKYFFGFLYENKYEAASALQKIENLTKIYYISLDPNKSYIGIISIIIIFTLTGLMTISIIFLLFDNFIPYFRFLSDGFWIITILGSIVLLSSCLTEINKITSLKCYLKIITLSLGTTFSLSPLTYKLITFFPDDNTFINWIRKHKYLYILFFILIDVMLFCFFYFNIYNIEDVIVNDGENFQRCKIANNMGHTFIYLESAYKMFLIGLLLFLVFTDWNISSIHNDIRSVAGLIFIDVMVLSIYFPLSGIKINNFKANYYIKVSLFLIISITNYMLLYGIRIIMALIKKQNFKSIFINNINNQFINNESSISNRKLSRKYMTNDINDSYIISTNNIGYSTNMFNNNDDNNDNKSSNDSFDKNSSIDSITSPIIRKIVGYHYSKE